MKKILFVITKSNWGGAQRYVYDLATSLPNEVFEVVVVLGGNDILKKKLDENNIRTISISHLQRDINLIKEFLSFKELFMIIWREKPDILHGNSSKAGGIGAFIGRILGIKKIIFTAHAWAFNEDRNSLSQYLISFLHWFSIVLSHTTIAVSESVKDQVSHFPFIKNKIKVIHLGISQPEFLQRIIARNALDINIHKNEIIIGTIAELHPVKGLDYALEAMLLMRNNDLDLYKKMHYLIIGSGGEKEKLQNYVFKKNLQDKVTFLAFKENASQFLKAFDLFLLPSLSEAFGYVLLEAGLAKVPILASDIGGIPEIIQNGITGKLIAPRDAKAIKSSIEEALKEPSELERMSETLFSKIKSVFSLENMLKKTIDIYLGNGI